MDLCLLHLRFLDPSDDKSPELLGTYQSPGHKGFWLAKHGEEVVLECDKDGNVIEGGRKAEYHGEQPEDAYLNYVRVIEGRKEGFQVRRSEIDGAGGVKLVEISAVIPEQEFRDILYALQKSDVPEPIYKKIVAAVMESDL